MSMKNIFQSVVKCGLRITCKDRQGRGDCNIRRIIILENSIDLILSCVVGRTSTPFRCGTIVDQLLIRVCVGSGSC